MTMESEKRFISYEEAFRSFLDRSDEKWAKATVLDDFFINFANEDGFVPQAGRPLAILDLGCSDGSVAADLIRALSYAHQDGFDYTGFDISEDFITTAKATISGISGVRSCNIVKTNNAFSDIRLFSRRFDIILLSHSLYYLDYSAIGDFLVQIQRALMPNGLAILFHQSHNIGWNGTALSHGYGEKDYTVLIAEQAAQRGLPMVDLLLYTKLQMPRLTPEQRRALNESFEQGENPTDPALREVMNIMSFLIYQSDRDDLGQLVMPAAIDVRVANDLLTLAEENEGTIPTFARMQIIPAPGADELLGKLRRTMAITDCDSPLHKKPDLHA